MEALLIIFAVVGLIWGLLVLLRGGLLAGGLLVLLSASCLGHPFINFSLAGIPLTIDRLMLVLLLAYYLLARRWQTADPKPIGKADVVLACLAAVLTLNTLAHDWQADNMASLMRLANTFLMPVALYWVVRQSPLSERTWYAMLGCCIAFGLYLALTAVAENRGLTALVFPRYISSPEFVEFLGRGRGPFLNPVGNGLYMMVALAAALLCWPRAAHGPRVLLLVLMGVLLLGLYFTLTRTIWMGTIALVLIIVGLSLPANLRIPMLGAAAIGGCLFVAVAWEHLLSFKRDKELTAAETADSVVLRPILATVAWKMFLDRPLLGHGFGMYNQAKMPYLSQRDVELPLYRAAPYVQHNVYLSLLTDVGLLGMGLFLLLGLLWVHHGWLLWTGDVPLWLRQVGLLQLAVAGAYLPNAMFHDVSFIPAANLLLFFIGGLTVGAVAGEGREPQAGDKALTHQPVGCSAG